MVKRLPWLIIAAGICVLSLPSKTWGCRICHFDYSTCDGVVGSSQCRIACFCASATQVNSMDLPHPGVFVAQEGGRLVVSGIVPNSPATRAGILPGDEILFINGREPFYSGCDATGWEGKESANLTRLVLNRDGTEYDVALGLATLRTFFEDSWIGRRGAHAVPVSMGYAPSPLDSETSFVLGMRGDGRGDYLLVTDILRGSPAQFAGIRIGDRIVTIDGRRVAELLDSEVTSLWSPEHRVIVRLGIERGQQRSVVEVTSAGVSEVLRNLSTAPIPDTFKPGDLASAR